MSSSYPLSVEQCRESIDEFVDAYVEERLAMSQSIGERYALLWQSIQRITKSGGKRLRPYMVLLSAHAVDETVPVERVIPVAAATELLHLALLVHDDIIDRDTVRRGVKNIGGQYRDIYESEGLSPREQAHYANSAAMLAGDLLITSSYECINQSDLGIEAMHQVLSIHGEAVYRVAGGELIDTEAAFLPVGVVNTLGVAREKTAWYSFVAPLTMGARLAGAQEDYVDQLAQFAETLGVAYQLQDDLLGVFGDEDTLGKSTSSDLTEGKYTYLVEAFYSYANVRQRTVFARAFGNLDATSAELGAARTVLAASGAKKKIEQKIDELEAAALEQLDALNLSPVYTAAFAELVDRSVRRRS